jgi:hypothetical protein
MDALEKEILKYEKNDFKAIQRRTLKHASKVVLKRKRYGGLGSDNVCVYYVDGDCTVDCLRECLKDYAKFHGEVVSGIGESGKGTLLCSGDADDRLFKDVRKALIRDEDARNSIKLVGLGKATQREVREEQPKRGVQKATAESSEILARIKKYTTRKMPKSEKDLDSMLVSYLYAFYPDISTRNTYENVDAQIGDTGIEIKYQPNRSDFDRLYGQIDRFLKHLEKVIVVIGYEKSRELTETFEKRIKERGWLNSKVFVVSMR